MHKKLTAVLFVALALLTLFFRPLYAHMGINYRLPTLKSILPVAFSIINTETVDISGHILAESKILSLRIDGKPVKFSGSKFMISSLPLSIGKNVFIFEILDSTGKRKFYSYTLYRKEELKEGAGPLPEATGSHETETKKVLSTDTAIVAEGFTPAVIASSNSPIAPVSTPSTSGYRIKNYNPQVISVVQQMTGGVTDGAGSTNNSNPQTDPVQTPVPDNKEEPMLSFSSPYKDQIITENVLQIGGRFNEFSHVKSITIGGQKCTISPASFTFTGPTLLSPGEARRRNVKGDSPEYIIMKVDPVTHAGKNTLTAQITDDAGHVMEEKITFYYYQLFVKLYSTGEYFAFPAVYVVDPNDPRHRETDINWWGTVKEIKLENGYAQAFNNDFLRDPPFPGWSDINSDYREYFPPGSPFSRIGSGGGFVYGNGISSYCNVSEISWLIYPTTEPWEYYARPGRGWGKLITTIHSPPLKERPFIVIFKDCHFIETEPMITGNSQLSLDPSKYKINGKYPLIALFDPAHKLISDPAGGLHQDTGFKRPAYIIMENPNPDIDIDITMDAPAYGNSRDDGVSWNYGWFRRYFDYYDMQTLDGDILVDSNNDGFLGGDDNAVEQVAPGCVLWVNDDDDYDESTVHPDDNNPSLASGETDCYDNIINGIRDLEDFMSINITIPNIKEWSGADQNVKFYLKAEGFGRIKIFERVADLNEYGEASYLKDLNSSIAQYKKPILIDIIAGDKKEIDSKYFDDNGNFRGIFEGVEQGRLKLSLIAELSADPNKKDTIILNEALITLKGIRKMYKAVNIRQGPENGSDGLLRYRNKTESGEIFAPDPKRVFIWAHGYNNTLEGSLGSADIVYKRLYRTGFRGSFIFISWDTADWVQPFSSLNFNGDWINSFRSAHITADIIKDTRAAYPNARIDIGAHSLGNSLILYALRLLSAEGQVPVDNTILAEAAVPGEVFIGVSRNPTYDMWGIRHDFFDNMYANSLNAVRGKIYNTYSKVDTALIAAFKGNNLILKLPTPLDDRYNLIKNATSTIGNEFIDPLGLVKVNEPYAKLVSKTFFVSKAVHPYGIKDHCSITVEYFYDVQEFYKFLLAPEKSDNNEEE